MNKYRGKFYHFHHHYYEMRLVFRPYVMFVQEPEFNRECVSTDSHGMRHQHIRGRDYSMSELREHFEECDVMVGGSTVFGVDASSNKTTISALMTEKAPDGVPVINLGIRGAMPQQELVAFMMLRHLLPKVRNIYIFSGVNVASYAAQKNSLIYEDYGCLFSEEYNYNLMREQYKLFTASHEDVRRYRTFDWFEALYDKSPYIRGFLRRFLDIDESRPELPGKNRKEQLNQLLVWFRRDLESWKNIKSSVESVKYVLQPAIGWNAKALSEREQKIMDEDRTIDKTLSYYATPEFYQGYSEKVAALCYDAGIEFHDANKWFDEPVHAGSDYFTDVCHLNDNGNSAVAEFMKSSGISK